ncbi:hypothetical protein RUND412_008244 [Rhizina undulata]
MEREGSGSSAANSEDEEDYISENLNLLLRGIILKVPSLRATNYSKGRQSLVVNGDWDTWRGLEERELAEGILFKASDNVHLELGEVVEGASNEWERLVARPLGPEV